MTHDPGPADFVVLTAAGSVLYGQREPSESVNAAIRRHVPDLGTQGMGRLRLWFCDSFTPDMPSNDVADRVIARLGYRHPTGWYGPVAVSMEENATGEVPPLLPEVRATIDELAGPVAKR